MVALEVSSWWKSLMNCFTIRMYHINSFIGITNVQIWYLEVKVVDLSWTVIWAKRDRPWSKKMVIRMKVDSHLYVSERFKSKKYMHQFLNFGTFFCRLIIQTLLERSVKYISIHFWAFEPFKFLKSSLWLRIVYFRLNPIKGSHQYHCALPLTNISSINDEMITEAFNKIDLMHNGGDAPEDLLLGEFKAYFKC